MNALIFASLCPYRRSFQFGLILIELCDGYEVQQRRNKQLSDHCQVDQVSQTCTSLHGCRCGVRISAEGQQNCQLLAVIRPTAFLESPESFTRLTCFTVSIHMRLPFNMAIQGLDLSRPFYPENDCSSRTAG